MEEQFIKLHDKLGAQDVVLANMAAEVKANRIGLEQHMSQTLAVKSIAEAAHARIVPIESLAKDVHRALNFIKWFLGLALAAYMRDIFK